MLKRKTSVMVIFAVADLFLLSCEHSLAPENGFYFVGKLNHNLWRGESDAQLNLDRRLVIWGIREYQPGNLDDIVIKVDFCGIGKYSIKAENAFLRYTFGYDQGCLKGISFGSPNDELTITKYDEQEQIIEGTFRFRLKGMNGYADVTFTNGWFRAKVRSGY